MIVLVKFSIKHVSIKIVKKNKAALYILIILHHHFNKVFELLLFISEQKRMGERHHFLPKDRVNNCL